MRARSLASTLEECWFPSAWQVCQVSQGRIRQGLRTRFDEVRAAPWLSYYRHGSRFYV